MILCTRVRSDQGMIRSMSEKIKIWLIENYQLHPSWSRKLHADNLRAWLELSPAESSSEPLSAMPSYATVVRFMKQRGFWKLARQRSPHSPSNKAQARLDARDVRRFDVEDVSNHVCQFQ